jgi:hypothetical protein
VTNQEIGQKSERKIEWGRTNGEVEAGMTEGDIAMIIDIPRLLLTIWVLKISTAKKQRSTTSMKTTPTDGIKFMQPTRSRMLLVTEIEPPMRAVIGVQLQSRYQFLQGMSSHNISASARRRRQKNVQVQDSWAFDKTGVSIEETIRTRGSI